MRTPAKTRKVEHVRNDPRATFLVERGEKWIELCAVMVYADVELLEPGEEYDAASPRSPPSTRASGWSRRRWAARRSPTPRSEHYAGRVGDAAPHPHRARWSRGTTPGCGSREHDHGVGVRRRRVPGRLRHRHVAPSAGASGARAAAGAGLHRRAVERRRGRVRPAPGRVARHRGSRPRLLRQGRAVARRPLEHRPPGGGAPPARVRRRPARGAAHRRRRGRRWSSTSRPTRTTSASPPLLERIAR